MKSTKTTVQAVLTSLALGLALLVAGPAQANTAPTSSNSLSHLELAHHVTVEGWIALNKIASQQEEFVDQLTDLMQEEPAEEIEEVVEDAEVVEESVVLETPSLAPTEVIEPSEEVPAPTEEETLIPVTGVATPSLSEEQEAKEFIAQKESGGSYTARNGIFYGRYQLTESYLNGDLSPENQERVADAYVAERYGSWVAAKAFWLENHWY